MRNEQPESKVKRMFRSKLRRLKLRRLKLKRLEMKTNTVRRFAGAMVLLAIISAGVTDVMAQRRRNSRVRRPARTRVIPKAEPVVYYTIPANTVLNVRMNQTIGSETARVGDEFTSTVTLPVYASGVEVIPAGSQVVGKVISVTRASRRSKAGTMGVHFVSLRLPTGIARAINAGLTNVSEDMNADNEGSVEAQSATKRNVVFIGGGAATGALIGAIAGGGKGAGIGAGVGAGLGVAGALFSKGHEVEVKSGTEFGVILNQGLSLPKANVR
ncbi:MAG TPA: hypothetical protein VJV03_17705 [Pyrinomonadaceae bacterium]|nr:hypothetical protein [Pyrinomonadaceae bacterium]